MATASKLRDSQRQRAYNAESEVSPGRTMPDMAVLAAYIQSRCRVPVAVRDGRGRRRAWASYNPPTIKIPRQWRTELTALHEIAHIHEPHQKHSWRWAAEYLRLVGEHMGDDKRTELLNAFSRNGVMWSEH